MTALATSEKARSAVRGDALGTGPATADDDSANATRVHKVTVDRPRQSINRALRKTPAKRPIVIRVVGACHENVTIERNNVTLEEISPSKSGIRGGPVSNPFNENPITVASANYHFTPIQVLSLREGVSDY